MSQPFKQMENIGSYLAACTSLGITGPQQFQTIDLYENKDMNSVLMNLNALKTLVADPMITCCGLNTSDKYRSVPKHTAQQEALATATKKKKAAEKAESALKATTDQKRALRSRLSAIQMKAHTPTAMEE